MNVTRSRAILINEINNLIFKIEMNTQILPIALQIEEPCQQPNITPSFPPIVTSYQQLQFSTHSLESLHGNVYQQPLPRFSSQISSQSQTGVSSPLKCPIHTILIR